MCVLVPLLWFLLMHVAHGIFIVRNYHLQEHSVAQVLHSLLFEGRKSALLW